MSTFSTVFGDTIVIAGLGILFLIVGGFAWAIGTDINKWRKRKDQ